MLAIAASEECLEAFEKMKMGKKTAYQIYQIDGGKIVVEQEVAKADAGEQKDYALKFIAALKERGLFTYFLSWCNERIFAQIHINAY